MHHLIISHGIIEILGSDKREIKDERIVEEEGEAESITAQNKKR
jgi:hypothetical protein